MKSSKRVRKIAENLIKEIGITKLPISLDDLEKIAKNKNWRILSYKTGEKLIEKLNLRKYIENTKGFAYASQDIQIIFFKDDLDYLEKISVICHEMGHLILNHISTGTGCKCKHISKEVRLTQEREANIFALELQAPIFLMKSMYIDSVKKLYEEGILCKSDARKQALYFYSTKINPTRIIIIVILTSILNKFYYMNFNDNDNPKPSNENTDSINEVITELTTYLPYNVFETIQTTETITQEPTTTQESSTIQEQTTIQELTTELTTSTTKSKIPIVNEPTTPVSSKPTNNTTPINTTPIQSETNETIVKITKTGKKYHKPTCYYVSNKSNTIEVTIEEALKKGLTPCSKCKPQ